MKSYYGDVLFPATLSVPDVTKPVSNELVSMTQDKTQGMVVLEAKTSGSAKDGTSYSLSLSVSHRCTYIPQDFQCIEADTGARESSPQSGQPFNLNVAVIGNIGASGTLSELRVFFDSLLLQSIVSK
jgi:hypothetical protein